MPFRYAPYIRSRLPQLRSRAFFVDDRLAASIEHPEPDEVIFADDSGRAHARRWTNSQNRWSAVRADTTKALIVTEGLYETAGNDVATLITSLSDALATIWPAAAVTGVEPL